MQIRAGRLRLSFQVVALYVAAISDIGGAQPPPTIPDTRDVANEIALLKSELVNHAKSEEDRSTNIGKQIDRVWQILLGFSVFFVAGSFLQTKMLERANQRSIDKSMEVAENKIATAADSIIEKINGKYEDPKALEQRIIGAVHQTFDPPRILKREILTEMVQTLQHEGMLDARKASRMLDYIARHY